MWHNLFVKGKVLKINRKFLKNKKFLICGESEEDRSDMQGKDRKLTQNWFEIDSKLIRNGVEIDVKLA